MQPGKLLLDLTGSFSNLTPKTGECCGLCMLFCCNGCAHTAGLQLAASVATGVSRVEGVPEEELHEMDSNAVALIIIERAAV